MSSHGHLAVIWSVESIQAPDMCIRDKFNNILNIFFKVVLYLPASTVLASQIHVFTRNSEWKGHKTM